MWRVFLTACLLIGAVASITAEPSGGQAALSTQETNQATAPLLHSLDTLVPSRGTTIPVTLTTPFPIGQDATATPAQSTPLVIMLHGHGGTRHEAGGYTRVAQTLARNGIASIRMDFPGCGDSEESFALNNLSNMLTDITSAQRWAENMIHVDHTRMGLLGFSMGGRLAITLAAKDPAYKAMALWAPAATNGAGNMQKYLGGADAYQRMKTQAKLEGYAPFTTFWGQQQQLGYQWFTDMEQSTPGVALQDFQGDLFVLYGDLDTVVLPEVSEAVIQAAGNARSISKYVIVGADHGLGLFSDEWSLSEQAVTTTSAFFKKHL